MICCLLLTGISLPAQVKKTADTLFIAYEPNYTFDQTSNSTTPWEARSKAEWQHAPYEGYIAYYSPRKVDLPEPTLITRLSEWEENREWFLPGTYNRILNQIKVDNFNSKVIFLVREGELYHLEKVIYRPKYTYSEDGERIDHGIRDTLVIDHSEVGRLRSPDSIDEKDYLLPISTFGEFLYMTKSNEVFLDTVRAPVDLWDLRRMFYKLQPGGKSSMDLFLILRDYHVMLRDGKKYYRLHARVSNH